MKKKKPKLSEFAKYVFENDLVRPLEDYFQHDSEEDNSYIYQLQEDDVIKVGTIDLELIEKFKENYLKNIIK